MQSPGNFHFNPTNNRSVHLIKELQQIQSQLNVKKKQLQRKKLQEQFYEDPNYIKKKSQDQFLQANYNSKPKNNDNNLNLADQIMNQLLNQNKSRKVDRLQKRNIPSSYQGNNNMMYQNRNNFNPPSNQVPFNAQFNQKPLSYQISSEKQNQFMGNYNPNKVEYPSQNEVSSSTPPPRQNNFIHPSQPQLNKRQLQKQKLQNPSTYNQNPFIPKNQPVKRSVDQKQQKPIVNQRQMQKLKLQQQSIEQNPFWSQNNRNRSQQRNYSQNVNQQPNAPMIQNIRQKQKQKLQRQLHNNNDFDIYQRPISPTNQIPAQKDNVSISKKAAFQNRYSNPFVKDEESIKQRKEEQLREYRRALQEQKKSEQERKKQEKQLVKEQKYAFNNFDPTLDPKKRVSSPGKQLLNENAKSNAPLNLTKKIDPNGKPPTYNYDQVNPTTKYISSSDIQYMKMKATELKQNYKKGRIHHDQYIQQIRKLAQFYKVDFKQLIDKKDLNDNQTELPWIKEAKKKQQENKTNNSLASLQKKNQNQEVNTNQKYQIIENEQSLQRFPDSQTSLKNNNNLQFYKEPSSPSKNHQDGYSSGNSLPQQSYNNNPFYYGGQYNPNQNIYTQNVSSLNGPPQYGPGLASTSFMQQFPHMDYDLMRRMFEELKSMRTDYTKSLQSQKNFLQQTFIKFMNNQMLQQQQLGQNNSNNRNSQQQKRNNQGKNVNTMSPKPNKKQQTNNQNIFSESSQENLTDQSMEFIEKSLSGIVNKIPFYSNSVNRKDNNNISNVNNQQSFTMEQNKNGFSKKNNVQGETVSQFFQKSYKVKKFKKFSIMVDVSQSSLQIPNVSNFLALKNGKDVVNRLFEEDLLMMKKLQRQRDVQKLRNRVDNQLSYGNYGDTFSGSNSNKKMEGQFINQENSSNQGNQKEKLITQQSKYQDYENYSRSKSKQTSYQQNHRSYKKIGDQQVTPQSGFLKRHVSNQEQNFPNFADQSDIKVRSPVYYSPKLNSQILQQDEYQTAQKSTNQQEMLESDFYGNSIGKKDKNVKYPQQKSSDEKYQMKKKDFAYEQQRESQRKEKSPTFSNSNNNGKQKSLPKSKNIGVMNIIQSNNQALQMYQLTPKNLNDYSPKQQEVDIKEYSSIGSNYQKGDQQLLNYFSGKNEGGSINEGPTYKKAPIVANGSTNSNNSSNGNNSNSINYLSDKFNSQKFNEVDLHNQQYEESLQTVRSQEQSVKFNSQKKGNNNNNKINPSNSNNIKIQQSERYGSMAYSHQSSYKPASIHISQTVQSIDESSTRMLRPPLYKKRSSSKKKQTSIIRTKFEKDSILQKPPSSESQLNTQMEGKYQNQSYDNDAIVQGQPVKFDSNVYDSEYEQTMQQKQVQTRIAILQRDQRISNKTLQPQIILNPPTIVASIKSSNLYMQNQSTTKVSSVTGSGKLKSLQEARNLAKQCKKKSITSTQNEYQRYEQKMSELESFLTKKDESSIFIKQQPKDYVKEVKYQNKKIKLGIQKSPLKSKNIMNLLDELQNQSTYKEDFESYREQSQRFN